MRIFFNVIALLSWAQVVFFRSCLPISSGELWIRMPFGNW